MNKKNYLITGICGFVCIAASLIVWEIFMTNIRAIDNIIVYLFLLGWEVLVGFGQLVNAIFITVIAVLSLTTLLINRNTAYMGLLISLGIFELILAIFSFIMLVLGVFIIEVAACFIIIALMSLACGIMTIVLATKLKSHAPLTITQPINNI